MKNKHLIIVLLIVIALVIFFIIPISQEKCEKISIDKCKDSCGVCPDSEVSSVMGCHSKEFCGKNCLKTTNKNCTSYTQCEYGNNTFGVCVDRTCFIPCYV